MSLENFGQYQLLKRLATGGMAQIYLARRTGEEGFEKLVVVKRILPHLSENEDFIRMFLYEATVAARLNHQNIVQIFDLGKEGSSYFIAMEFIHGDDVRRVWRQSEAVGRPLPVPLVCRVVIDACAGLDYAHKKVDVQGIPLDIVHRDISPQNILVTFEGGVKVVDFGIAKAADQATVTRSGVLKGKYSYMSPEQAAGKRIDRRSDVFALGVVLYELLTGTRLFKRASDIQTLTAVGECKVIPPSQVNDRVPPSLDPVVMKALTRQVDDRYPDALSLQLALEEWLTAEQHAASTAHLAAFMREIFAERLEREAREGIVGGMPESLSPRPEHSPTGQRTSRPTRERGLVKRARTAETESTTFERPATRGGALRRRTAEPAYSLPPLELPSPPGRVESGSFPVDVNASELSYTQPTVAHRAGSPRWVWALLAGVIVAAGGYLLHASLKPATPVAPPPAQVTFLSEPSGAKVTFDGKPVEGTTPVTLPEVAPGRYAYSLQRQGYQPFFAQVTVPLSGTVSIPAVLVPEAPPTPAPEPQTPPAPEQARPQEVEAPKTPKVAPDPMPQRPPRLVKVRVDSQPAGGRVTVNGQGRGTAPVTVSLPSRSWAQIHVTHDGYHSAARRVRVGSDPDQSVVVSLNALKVETAIVRFAVTPWAKVTCGKYDFGDTPFPDKVMEEGSYTCVFRNPQRGEQRKRIVVKRRAKAPQEKADLVVQVVFE